MENSKIITVLYVALIFLVGFLAAQAVSFYYAGYSIGGVTGFEANAPSDYLSNGDITVYSDRVVLRVGNAGISNYAPTGSMLPVLHEGANGITIKPESEDEIEVGDIISYWSGEELIAHRVVKKGNDDLGIYFVTKGDNSTIADGKIRYGQVEHVLVGVIY
jgi:signal peptidase I